MKLLQRSFASKIFKAQRALGFSRDLVFQYARGTTKGNVFFLHVPKCGGTAIRRAIWRSLGLVPCVYGWPVEFLEAASSWEVAKRQGLVIHRVRDILVDYELSRPYRRYVAGHCRFRNDLHEFHKDRWYFVTLLREPEALFYSHYFYNREQGEQTHTPVNETLDEFIETQRAVNIGCSYIRVFCGEDVSNREAQEERWIKKAIANLERFDIVGLLEKQDHFCSEFRRLLGARLLIREENKTILARDKREEEISDSIRERVHEICRPNREVYETIKRKIDEEYPVP